MPHTGLVPIYGHIVIGDRFCDKVEFLIFGRVAPFYDSCAYGLNNTATPPPDTSIGAIFQVVKCEQSPIYSTASLLFSAIAAVVEVEVGR